MSAWQCDTTTPHSRHDACDGVKQSTPSTASAAAKPCELYVHNGGSAPSVTEGHHIHPVYLQNTKYGHIVDKQLVYLCGTCHDNVHAWLYWLMGERSKPNPVPPPRARALAQLALDWFRDVA